MLNNLMEVIDHRSPPIVLEDLSACAGAMFNNEFGVRVVLPNAIRIVHRIPDLGHASDTITLLIDIVVPFRLNKNGIIFM